MEETIINLENEIKSLKKELQLKEEQLMILKTSQIASKTNTGEDLNIPKWAAERYSRQALLSELGSPKEIISTLIRSSVLVIGAGGLGCPAAMYLVGAGVGHIGIVDYDEVELTNVHRQPLHSELTLGMSKVESAMIMLQRLNSNVHITPYNLQLDSTNALDIFNNYDVIIDATDNAVTRYLINDACVLTGKPLVSAAALQLSGQFTVYNYCPKEFDKEKNFGPCYRCIFPNPPPPETMGSCSQNGVLGPIPGVMGCLQAIETIKILLGKCSMSGYLLIYDGAECTFNKVKLRGKNKNCEVCSENPTISKLIDYEKFCNAQASDKEMKLDILSPLERISPIDFYKNIYSNFLNTNKIFNATKILNYLSSPISLIDVRSNAEFDLCNLQSSINIPINKIDYTNLAESIIENDIKELYFICRRGNDSQIACRSLSDVWNAKFQNKDIIDNKFIPIFKDIEGGLHQWSNTVDNNFPIY